MIKEIQNLEKIKENIKKKYTKIKRLLYIIVNFSFFWIVEKNIIIIFILELWYNIKNFYIFIKVRFIMRLLIKIIISSNIKKHEEKDIKKLFIIRNYVKWKQ